VVAPKGAPRDGSTPTLLYGYGGFEVDKRRRRRRKKDDLARNK